MLRLKDSDGRAIEREKGVRREQNVSSEFIHRSKHAAPNTTRM